MLKVGNLSIKISILSFEIDIFKVSLKACISVFKSEEVGWAFTFGHIKWQSHNRFVVDYI